MSSYNEDEKILYDAFLGFLEQDITQNPQKLITATNKKATETLLKNVSVPNDHDEMPEDFEL